MITMGAEQPRRGIRPGGRAVRIQAAVFAAVRDLSDAGAPPDLTVPAIAARAGVTPSTIYRRWGTLERLLSDVALERLLPDGALADTGDLHADLAAWLDAYVDELATTLGRDLLREIVAPDGGENASLCADRTRRQLEAICQRAAARDEWSPDASMLIDRVVAPLVYRILFNYPLPQVSYARSLLDCALREGRQTVYPHPTNSD